MKHAANIQYYQLLLLLSITIVVCISSCVVPGYTGTVPISRQKDNLLYSSNSPNMPILQGKGSGVVNVSGSFGNSGSSLNGAELQSAFAPGKNIGMQINGFVAGRKNQEPQHHNNEYYVDWALGYYRKINKTISLELFGGLGTGSTKNEHYTGYSKINYTKVFLQPSVGYSSNDGKFKAAAGFRFSRNRFIIREQAFNTTDESFSATEFSELSLHPKQFFIEPSALLRYGWKTFQFQFQYSELLQTAERTYNMGKSRWTLGLSFPF